MDKTASLESCSIGTQNNNQLKSLLSEYEKKMIEKDVELMLLKKKLSYFENNPITHENERPPAKNNIEQMNKLMKMYDINIKHLQDIKDADFALHKIETKLEYKVELHQQNIKELKNILKNTQEYFHTISKNCSGD